ncbi:MAG: acetyl ornithine aminotransferase family protein [Caldiserica bacterium]|jgi:4-aminobutyrate aminotransferase|nr:acetyl ornithine aminotransferase family protein [Caldisericota bacterium]MDH7562497.1 acetyl ornithine aminotransferase family protein [Caldisericota bacterium]
MRLTEGPKIRVPVPGEETKRIVSLDETYLATGTKGSPVAIKWGRGVRFEDLDGNLFLDFTNGMVAGTGHSHPRVVRAIQEQAEKFLFFNGPDFYYEVQSRIAQKLCQITPGDFPKKVFLSNSGAEANEAALKLSRSATGKKQFVAFLGAFHGRTMGALALTASKVVQRESFFPMMPGVTHLPFAYCYRCAYKMKPETCNFWCAQILEDLYFKSVLPPEEVAAVFMEPVQGEGGYVVPPVGFVQKIKKICEKYDILFVADEVQSGFGKTGEMFAIQHFGVVPDVINLGKAMASGLPMGATVFNSELDFPVQGRHSNTFGGNPISAVAALATIEAIEEEKLLENTRRMGDLFKKGLMDLMADIEEVGDVRGLGLMLAIELVKDRETKTPARELRDKVIENCYKNGLLLLPCGTSAIRFTPAMVINREEVEKGLEILRESILTALKN